MPLDLTDNATEKTKEQYMDEAWAAIKARLRMQALQNRNTRDTIRAMMLESQYYTALEINTHIGETNSELLSDMDATITSLLDNVVI